MFTWVLILAIGIVIGLALGVYFMRLDDEAKRTQQGLQQQLELSKTELQLYKAEVQKSYVTTAHLINNLTDSYKAVHQHLSQSATMLCGDVASVNKLDLKDSPNLLAQHSTSDSGSPEKTHDPHAKADNSSAPSPLSTSSTSSTSTIDGAADSAAPGTNDSAVAAVTQSPEPNVVAASPENDEPNVVDGTHNNDAQITVSQEASSSEKSTVAESSREIDDNDLNSELKAKPRQREMTTSTKTGEATPLTPEEEDALQEKLKLEQARVEASRMIH